MNGDENPFEASNRLNEITRDLDERGLVLTLASFAEEALGELLAQFMRPGDAANKLLNGFSAPLGTFSARTRAAFALGLITTRQQENLDRLRQIRNAFAHKWEPVSFEDQAAASHIEALHFIPLVSDFPATKVEKLRTCISSILVEIKSTTNQIRKKQISLQLIGNHLVPGILEEETDRVAICVERLAKIEQEMGSAKGERRKFLGAQRERWLSLLTIYARDTTGAERVAIAQALEKYGPLPPV